MGKKQDLQQNRPILPLTEQIYSWSSEVMARNMLFNPVAACKMIDQCLETGLGFRIDLILHLWEETAMILFVDNDGEFREVMLLFLRMFGYQTDAAQNGEEALSLFDETRHDMVITDNDMPGMSGADLVRRIKQKHPSFPVIGITGGDTKDLIKAGATRCFLKPFEPNEVEEAIQEILGATG